MFTNSKQELLEGLLVVLAFNLILSACALPMPSSLPQSSTIVPGVPDAMLTAAAATIIAQLNPGETFEAGATDLPGTSESKVQAPEATLEGQSPAKDATNQEPPTTGSVEDQPITTETANQAMNADLQVTSVPVVSMVSENPYFFEIQSAHLLPCNGEVYTYLAIKNLADMPFESVSMAVQDLTTGAILLGAWQSASPFVESNLTCTLGEISKLLPGQVLYLGSSLGGSALRGHNLQAIVKLCSLDNLSGTCSQVSFEYLVP